MKVHLGGTTVQIQRIQEVETLPDMSQVGHNFVAEERKEKQLRLDRLTFEEEALDSQRLQRLVVRQRSECFGSVCHLKNLMENNFTLNSMELNGIWRYALRQNEIWISIRIDSVESRNIRSQRLQKSKVDFHTRRQCPALELDDDRSR